MSATFTRRRGATVSYSSLDAMPPREPLSDAFKALGDEEIDRLSAEDPDIGTLPPDFWEGAEVVDPEAMEQITLQLDREVLSHFRGEGDYEGRINAVLKRYVRAKDKERAR